MCLQRTAKPQVSRGVRVLLFGPEVLLAVGFVLPHLLKAQEASLVEESL